jgi:hypothetical protein
MALPGGVIEIEALLRSEAPFAPLQTERRCVIQGHDDGRTMRLTCRIPQPLLASEWFDGLRMSTLGDCDMLYWNNGEDSTLPPQLHTASPYATVTLEVPHDLDHHDLRIKDFCDALWYRVDAAFETCWEARPQQHLTPDAQEHWIRHVKALEQAGGMWSLSLKHVCVFDESLLRRPALMQRILSELQAYAQDTLLAEFGLAQATVNALFRDYYDHNIILLRSRGKGRDNLNAVLHAALQALYRHLVDVVLPRFGVVSLSDGTADGAHVRLSHALAHVVGPVPPHSAPVQGCYDEDIVFIADL